MRVSIIVLQHKDSIVKELRDEAKLRESLDQEVGKLQAIIEDRESSLLEEKKLVTQLQSEVSRLKVQFEL